MSSLAERFLQVNQKIEQACTEASRSADDVTLIVVTKNHPVQLVEDLLQIGARDFGENRDQEARPKAEHLLASGITARSDYRWHFVGQLQSNKVKSVLTYADYIHSLDRDSLLHELIKVTTRMQAEVPDFSAPGVFIQLNLTDDPGRGGIQPENIEPFADAVLAAGSLKLCGVMAVASLEGNSESDFERVYQVSQKLQRLAPHAKSISAGMSNDFEIAIRHGATHLRIGTAITGNR